MADQSGFQISRSQRLSEPVYDPWTVNRNSLGDRPVLYFRSDLEYLGYSDLIDPLCSRANDAVSLPAMILPALPKLFYFATSFGQEWKPFWDGLWRRAECAIEKASELVIVGYSLPTADERAREMLLNSKNKAVRLSICCHSATTGIEQEFRKHGFKNIAMVSPTFEGLLTEETARGDNMAETEIPNKTANNCSTDIVSRLKSLVGTKGLLRTARGEFRFTFLSVEPAPNLPAETDPVAFQNAISLSSFRVRFDDGILIDGSHTKIISGFDISCVYQ